MTTDLHEELRLTAASGNLVRVQQIMEELGGHATPQATYTALNQAAWKGHADLVRWLCSEGGAVPDLSTFWTACRSGDLDLVKWVNGARREDETFGEEEAVGGLLAALERACDAGKKELAQYLRGLIPTEDWGDYFPDDGDSDDDARHAELNDYAQGVMRKYNECIDSRDHVES